MLYVYGSLMPLRILEEVRFWKMQEKEHTEVIRALIPNLEERYVHMLNEWEKVFAHTEAAAVQWIEALIRSPVPASPYVYKQVQNLVHTSTIQSQRWVQQLFTMQEHSAAVKANPLAPVVIQHIIRESEYFLGILQTIISQSPPHARQHSAARTGLSDLSATGEGVWSAAPGVGGAGGAGAGAGAGGVGGAGAGAGAAGSPGAVGDIGSAGSVGTSGSTVGAGTGVNPSGKMNPEDPRVVPIGGHKLPPLPYAYNALEPYIDAETMRIHHDLHHLSYVEGLNTAEKELEKARRSGQFDLVKHWERELAFNGAGHYLHTLFWNVMHPKGGGKPQGELAEQINRSFGSFDQFRKQFSAAANKVEGGGWAILVWSPRSRRLEILQAEKHQNLSQWDVIPLLALDVWEHAYYLKYRNNRAGYIDAWWNIVNWPEVQDRYADAKRIKWPPY